MENDCLRYSVVIYTENQIGLLTQFSNIFQRRGLSIWSLLALPTDIPDIHYLTIVTDGPEKSIHNAVLHLEDRIDVVKAFYYPGDLIEHPDKNIFKLTEDKVKAFIHDRTVEKENFLNNNNK